jgi:SnoaL-like domain
MDNRRLTESEQKAVTDCQRLIALVSWLGDQGDAEGYANCFTADGIFDRGGEVIAGREALTRFIEARSLSTSVRHFNSLPVIGVESPDSATGVILSAIWRREGGGPAKVVHAEIHDDYTLTEGGWRIARRVAHAIAGDS